MNKQTITEVKVGLFVTVGLGLAALAIFLLGDTQSLFSKKSIYISHFSRVDGLIPGAKVIIGGVPVGTVEAIGFHQKNRNIQVQYSIVKEASDWVREDSTVEIATQGMLGDKYLSINAGSETQAALPPGSEIPYRPSKDFSQFISNGDQLVLSLNHLTQSLDRILKSFETDNRSEIFFKGIATTAKNLSQASEKLRQEVDEVHLKGTIDNLHEIVRKINNGTGTVGSLINDPGLYDEVKALLGGANRNRIMRNLIRQSIKENSSPDPSKQ